MRAAGLPPINTVAEPITMKAGGLAGQLLKSLDTRANDRPTDV